MLVPFFGHIHFIGIGGIGMSGIAELLFNLGYSVKGSDVSKSSSTKRLESMGIKIFLGHNESNVESAQVVVASSAISKDNPELVAAKNKKIPIIQRAEMLAELMRLKKSIAVSGSHGKTTTTSMVAAVLSESLLDPTVVNGGIINSYNANAKLGKGEWIVVEADESDGSFLKLFPTICVITNIDLEHMEHYKTEENLKNSFLEFAKKVPFYGVSVLCTDHPVVKEISLKLTNCITYGFNEDAQVRATNIRLTSLGSYFDVDFSKSPFVNNVKSLPFRIKDFFIPMLGEHNVLNALVSIAVGTELKIDEENIKKGLYNFKGVKRRFTKVDEVNGISIIDDYAHHPVEIKTVIKASLLYSKGRVIVVAQPHRYTRLRDCFEDFKNCFEGAFAVFLLPVYAAREQEIEGISSESLSKSIRNVPIVKSLNSESEIVGSVGEILSPNDVVLFVGAGNITQFAYNFPEDLKNFLKLNSSRELNLA